MQIVRIASGRRNVIASFVFATALASGVAQQRTAIPAQSKPVPMPQDRVADSYEIYSLLLPGHEIEWGDAPRTQWLVEDTTTALPLDSPCASGGMMNPHGAIQAPEARQEEFAEVLADFDEHCHERYLLDGSKFRVALPVHMLDGEARARYARGVSGLAHPRHSIMEAPPTPDEFKGAAGMHSFTAVYFNRSHTLAMTQIGMYCGSLCGNWKWVALERINGQWKILPWVRMVTFS